MMKSSNPSSFKASEKPSAPAWKATLHHYLRAARHWFHREQLISFAKTMSLVAPLTVLIWVYAEREQTDTDPGVVFPIEVRSNDPNRIVSLTKPVDKNIVADLSGPRARLDRLRDQLIPRAGMSPVTIDVDATLTPRQSHELNTSALLSSHPLFANAGITVTSASPPRLTVYVDEIIEVEARVEAPPEIKNLESPPVFDPPVIQIRGPERVLSRSFTTSTTDNKFIVVADLTSLNVINQPGVHEDIRDIPLRRPETENNITFNPPRVSATIHIRQTDRQIIYPSMPIWPLMAPTLQDKYKVAFEGGSAVITNVPLVGPPERIALLEDPNFTPRPKAVLEVTSSDLPPGQPRTRRLEFDDLPEGVRVAPGYAQNEITFELVERAPAE